MHDPSDMTFNADDPCPCRSGRPAGQCCVTSGRPVRKPATTKPRGPRTDQAEDGCYAAPLRDCKGGLTKEHYISRTLLRQLGSKFRIYGVPWATDEGAPASPESLTSRILCERHNSVLSGLDTAAGELFSLLADFRRNRHEGDLLLAGEDIERWILKVLLGTLNAGVVTRHDDMATRDIQPPLWILEILYGETPIRDGWGLWVSLNPGGDASALQFNPNSYPPEHELAGQVWGATVHLVGINFTFAMKRVQLTTGADTMFYRPPFIGLSGKARLLLSWERGSGKTGFVLDALRPEGGSDVPGHDQGRTT